MKVNIGSGQERMLGFINVNADPWARPDVVAVPMDLPFDPGSVSEMHVSQVLEHLADPVAALRYWRKLLTPNGVLWIVVSEHRSACPTCAWRAEGMGGRIRAQEANESRADHQVSPYFMRLCLNIAGYGEISRVAAPPQGLSGESSGLLIFRATNLPPLGRLVRRLRRVDARQFAAPAVATEHVSHSRPRR